MSSIATVIGSLIGSLIRGGVSSSLQPIETAHHQGARAMLPRKEETKGSLRYAERLGELGLRSVVIEQRAHPFHEVRVFLRRHSDDRILVGAAFLHPMSPDPGAPRALLRALLAFRGSLPSSRSRCRR